MLTRNVLELTEFVAPILDEAIATVAEKEFNRLCALTNNDAQVAEDIVKAVKSIKQDLEVGNLPNYNEWQALFYLTWYQPRQINIVLKILQTFFERFRYACEKTPAPFHVIDLGCGAFAVRFAIALFALQHRIDISDVAVKGIDPSNAMTNIGDNLWKTFRSIVKQNPNPLDLSHTCEHLTSNFQLFDSHTSYSCTVGTHAAKNPSIGNWMMAIHAVYHANKANIKDALKTIHRQCDPSMILLTCKNSPSRLKVARFVVGERFECQITLGVEGFWFSGPLPRTSKWRKSLICYLPENARGEVRGLLDNPVTWGGGHNTALFYRESREEERS